MKERNYKLMVILLVIGVSLWLCLPLKQKIKLGLDLSGGMDMVLEVDVKKLKSRLLDETIKEIKGRLAPMKLDQVVGFSKGNIVDEEQKNLEIIIDLEKVPTESREEAVKVALGDDFKTALPVTKSSRKATIQVSAIGYKVDDAVERALEIIRNRIDDIGVANVDIKREGSSNIRVQLPGVEDPEQARMLIGQTAQLEFKLVKRVLTSDKYRPGPGEEILPGTRYFNKFTGKTETPFYVLDKDTLLSGETLRDARVGFDQFNQPEVLMDFNAIGTQKFGKITSEHIQERLAIILDGKVQQAPVIQGAILQGSARITGYESLEEAQRISIVLRNGALPAPVEIAEDRTVGPTLGKESIKAGTYSIGIGFLLVVIYMIFYYKVSGVIANGALILNLVILLGCLAFFNASLTLPGIAGILLTIGMSVDANVIIYERIKEELRDGKSVRAAIDAGFAKAFSAIIDANVTTLITAAVLYWQGSGPIKGFAVTLAIGIMASMFTALFCVRTVLDYMTSGKKASRLSI
ncbi:MAG: protein translocase subunit SecD [Candidatus Wallbacteria bacterium HGW-Wallbacteria-1]|jgi:preprotein translocase subunit SecD|uniref:Protein translocase subunit SecD n=1 Tax=Candidatus Wallbacteria bacterium HGW-Wallbacteria-1 TaxID=2013854 RepID=A0A2N1PUW1_9BACT|nr:MAG: protein translocase subunit SecD [Candidatus Wallbacteria bacterium HGW-Wallbacteria-1]